MIQVGERAVIRRTPVDDPWLERLLGRTGVVIERGIHEARGHLRPLWYVVLDLGGGDEVALLESECEALVEEAV